MNVKFLPLISKYKNEFVSFCLMLRNVVFSDIGTPENGAAICVTGINIEIFCCKFIKNLVYNRGGAISCHNLVMTRCSVVGTIGTGVIISGRGHIKSSLIAGNNSAGI